MSSGPGRILLVDHSRGALLFQETILRRRDMAIMTALAGSEGLSKARQERPNLIIFGYDLFDMTAPEFCREVRGHDDTRAISLLLVCDREHTDHGDLCLSAGCNDVIFRPLQKPELDAKVERLTNIPVRRQLRTITKIEVSMERDGRFVLGRSCNISIVCCRRTLRSACTSIFPAIRSLCSFWPRFCGPSSSDRCRNTACDL
jgi:PleD family two-component response regulator